MVGRSLTLFAMLCWTPAVTIAQTIQTGQLEAQLVRGKGYSLIFSQVPVTRGSSLQLYAPGWTQGCYSSDGERPQTQRQDDVLVLTHAAKKVKFHATETVRIAGENHLEITLKGKLDSPVDARLEWAIGYVNAFALYGGSVSGLRSDMLIPIFPEPTRQEDPQALVAQSQGASFTSRIGRFTVHVEQGPRNAISVLDGRRAPQRWWAQEEPTLWLGMLEAPIRAGEEFEFRVSVEFKPKTQQQPPPEEQIIDAPAERIDRAFVPKPRAVQIIPRPGGVKWTRRHAVVNADTRLYAQPEFVPAAEIVAREVKRRFGWTWIINGGKKPAGSTGILFVSTGRGRRLWPESYLIDSEVDSITITADDVAGARHGAHTLVQLFQVAERGVVIQTGSIGDTPSLNFRGVHLFPGRDSVDFYRRLCERVLARFKFNHVIIQADYTEWDTDRRIWIPQSVPKEQLAEYVKITRENGLEPIPLVQSLGHAEWMFKNGANLDIAEDPDEPYAYAVTEPRTYDFIHGVFREAIEVFDNPKYFHVGHDEIDMRGRYPHREEAKRLGKTKLIAMNLARHDEFLRARGIRMMLWGDMLLAREESPDGAAFADSVDEAQARRAAVPKDAIICDWHYDPHPPEQYRSLRVFGDAGFQTIACTWHNPQNVRNFAEAARIYRAWGLLQTTWAGYHVTEETLARDPRQFEAYVLAAEHAWSSDWPKPRDLRWRADEVLASALDPQPERTETLPGALFAIGGQPLEEFLGYADLSALAQQERVEGIRFRVEGAIMLTGRLLSSPSKHARKVILKTDVTADEIAFLHATAVPARADEEVGTYVVTYADGTTERIPLRYGRQIRAWNDLSATPGTSGGWFGRTPEKVRTAVRVLRWPNPSPEKGIVSVSFNTEHPYASPTLFAITALGGK